jgi:hypothetical protein
MSGNAKQRFCEHCQLHVHNLSAMSSRERARVTGNTGVCITYEIRRDGSMVTPPRWALLIKPLQRACWAAAALIPILFSSCATRRTLGRMSHSCDGSHAVSNDQRHARLLGEIMPPSPAPREK